MGLRRVGAVAWVAASARGQDMRGDCVSCGDVLRKCELECVAPDRLYVDPATGRPGLGRDVGACLGACGAAHEACEETPEASACFACVTECAEAFEASMLRCVREVAAAAPRGGLPTSGAGREGCPVDASATMDACVDGCHGGDDVAAGWTPEAEEGRPRGGPFDRAKYARNEASANERNEFMEPERRDEAARHPAPPARTTEDREAALSAPAAATIVWPADASARDLQALFLGVGVLGVAMLLAGLVLQTHQAYATHSSAAIQRRDEAKRPLAAERERLRPGPGLAARHAPDPTTAASLRGGDQSGAIPD